MKFCFLFFFTALFSLYAFSQTYTPIAVSGFNEDVVAETTPATTTTTNSMDLSNYIMYSQAFASATSISGGILNSGTIVSGTRTYQMEPFTSNNGLHIAQGTPQTLSLITPAQFSQISLMGFSTESSCTVTFTLHFTNGTSTNFTGVNILDWFTGTGNIYCCYGRTTRIASGYVAYGLPSNPNYYPIDLTLSCADQKKLLQSIDITITSGTTIASRVYILALSGVAYSLNITSNVTNIGCSGGNIGSATLNATGTGSPYTYSWNTTPVQNTATAINLSAGNHVCTISDAAGCAVKNDTITIGQTLAPAIVMSATQDTICNGQSTQITASGLASVLWFPTGLTTTSINVSPTVTTRYFANGTGTNGCTGLDSILIVVHPKPVVATSPITANSCNGANVQLSAGYAVAYTWSPTTALSSSTISNPVANPTVSTTYFLLATDTNGCTIKDTVKVNVYALPTVAASVNPTTICGGDTATLTTNGLANFTWAPGGQTTSSVKVFPASTTTYTVSGTDANGCHGQASTTLTVLPTPNLITNYSATAICANSGVTLIASGATNYTWSPSSGLSTTTSGTTIASPTITTTYTVSSTNSSNACVRIQHVIVTVNPLPIVNVTANPPTICGGNSSQLSVSSLTNFTWIPSGQITTPINVSPTTATTYSVSGTDANGCAGSGSVTVNVTPAPFINVSSADTTICAGSSVVLTANGGATSYTWQPGNLQGSSISVAPSVATNYTATGLFPGPCTVSASLAINIFPKSVAAFGASPTSGCSPLKVNFLDNSTNATSWHWSFSDGGSSAIKFASHIFNAGTWSVTLITSNANNCADTLTKTNYINANPHPTANFGTTPSPTIPVELADANYQMNNYSTGAVNYAWFFGDNTTSNLTAPTHSYSTPGDYFITLVAINAAGCTDTTTVGMFEVFPPSNIVAPSAFSPNGDGANDIFRIIYSPLISKINFTIYNRWGEMVFQTNNPKEGWDGTFNGIMQPLGVYMYTVNATFTDGKNLTKQGNVTLVK